MEAVSRFQHHIFTICISVIVRCSASFIFEISSIKQYCNGLTAIIGAVRITCRYIRVLHSKHELGQFL